MSLEKQSEENKMELDTKLVHGLRKAEYDAAIYELFAAGYNATQVYRILKHNGITLSRGTIYKRLLEYKNAAEINQQHSTTET